MKNKSKVSILINALCWFFFIVMATFPALLAHTVPLGGTIL